MCGACILRCPTLLANVVMIARRKNIGQTNLKPHIVHSFPESHDHNPMIHMIHIDFGIMHAFILHPRSCVRSSTDYQVATGNIRIFLFCRSTAVCIIEEL